MKDNKQKKVGNKPALGDAEFTHFMINLRTSIKVDLVILQAKRGCRSLKELIDDVLVKEVARCKKSGEL